MRESLHPRNEAFAIALPILLRSVCLNRGLAGPGAGYLNERLTMFDVTPPMVTETGSAPGASPAGIVIRIW